MSWEKQGQIGNVSKMVAPARASAIEFVFGRPIGDEFVLAHEEKSEFHSFLNERGFLREQLDPRASENLWVGTGVYAGVCFHATRVARGAYHYERKS
jgi:hypothetical protein